jgi:predicted RND superfamily exporter protein
MTTVAMASGMLPVALSLTGGDSSVRQPMAILVIGGVIASTFLSLMVIPVIFTFVDDLLEMLKRLVRWSAPPHNEDADPEAHPSDDWQVVAFERSSSKRGRG